MAKNEEVKEVVSNQGKGQAAVQALLDEAIVILRGVGTDRANEIAARLQGVAQFVEAGLE